MASAIFRSLVTCFSVSPISGPRPPARAVTGPWAPPYLEASDLDRFEIVSSLPLIPATISAEWPSRLIIARPAGPDVQ